MEAYRSWLAALFESPERARLFLILAERPASLGELTAASGLTLDTATEHLNTLERLGIVRQDTSHEHLVYRLDEARIRQASEDLATTPSDFRSLAGRPAPLFRLTGADGSQVALEDCLARGPVVVWFSSGLVCPICRRNRARLTLGYPSFRSLGAELLEVTPTLAERARLYFSNYRLSFPYLCDPDRRVWDLYGLRPGRLGPLHVLSVLLPDVLGAKTVLREWLHGPQIESTPEERASLGNEYGFIVIDQAGMIRHAQAGPYLGLPSNAEIEHQLQELRP
jgi:peroxiredoxin/DNA-binding transcriptional ArsR family regulator